jgi:hypothetical protein
MHKYTILALFCLLAGPGCTQNKSISFNNPCIRYEGRIWFRPEAAELTWPGTSATVILEGTGISAVLKDTDTADYYNVIVDGHVAAKIHPDTVKRSYLLASGLPEGTHTIQLFKRTECEKGQTLLYGFEPDGHGKFIPAPDARKRTMEFYGNSITCGYGIEDSSGQDSWHGCFENNYLTYAAITARHFDARYSCVSKSGIGVMVSWFPLIMPEMYDRVVETDSVARWDFSKYTPDIVVINLFQNDSWLVRMPDNPEFRHRFGATAPGGEQIIAAYKNFVTAIRQKYPGAHIICVLGNMDATREGSAWPGYIQQAVSQMQDPKIYTHFFPYKMTDGHPDIAQHDAMARSLIEFIDQNIQW